MKNLDKLGLETKKPPQIQGTRPGTALRHSQKY